MNAFHLFRRFLFIPFLYLRIIKDICYKSRIFSCFFFFLVMPKNAGVLQVDLKK